MSGLNLGVSAWLQRYRSSGAELRTYYRDLYGVGDERLAEEAEQWEKLKNNRSAAGAQHRSGLPGLIETLSLIDVCIADEHSLGPSSLPRPGAEPTSRHVRRVEINPDFLRAVRAQLTMAIGSAVEAAATWQPAKHTRALLDTLNPDDVLITTNWDMLIENAVIEKYRADSPSKPCVSPFRYHCVGERIVDYPGADITKTSENPRSVLRLHGALNWFGCPCCGTVYINLQKSLVIDPENRRLDFDECHCGAGLLTVMIAPTFLKDYRSVSLKSVWREAQKQLESADEWIFIGYSLPIDDFHIRAMLMRAFRSRAVTRAHTSTKVSVFLGEGASDAGERYRDLFRMADLSVYFTGLSGWLRSATCDPSS